MEPLKPKIDQRLKVIFKSYEHDYTRIIRRTNAKSILGYMSLEHSAL